MRSRKELRQESEPRKSRWVLWVLVGVLVVSLSGGVYFIGFGATASDPQGASSTKATPPAPTPSVSETPTATPTQAASTPAPPPLPCMPDGTTITIPNAGIDRNPVRAFTDADWDESVVHNPHTGGYDAVGGVSPVGDFDMVFYDRLQIPGSCMSSEATNTNYLYCHSNGFKDALCNLMPTLVEGDVVIIETPSERLTYTMKAYSGSFPVYKVDFKTHPDVTVGQGGRLVVTTCYKDGERDGNNATSQVTVSIFQLTRVESLIPVGEVKTDPKILDRLE